MNHDLLCSTAKTLLRFRDVMWSLVRYYVEKNVNRKSIFYSDELENSDCLDNFKKEMLQVLASVLSSASGAIDDSDTYNNNNSSILNRPDDGNYR